MTVHLVGESFSCQWLDHLWVRSREDCKFASDESSTMTVYNLSANILIVTELSAQYMMSFKRRTNNTGPKPLPCGTPLVTERYGEKQSPVFTAQCYASAVLAMGLCLSVCVCPSVSVTSRSSTKTAKRRITQTTPHDTRGTLVFWRQRSPRNSTRVTPYEGAECTWGGQNRRLSTNNRLYLENGKR